MLLTVATMSFCYRMDRNQNIERIVPRAAIPGAEIAIDFAAPHWRTPASVTIDDISAQIVASSRRRVLVLVPHDIQSATAEVSVEVEPGPGHPQLTPSASVVVGTKLAGDLHPVANPAFDPADGSLYVTRSGSRGEP